MPPLLRRVPEPNTELDHIAQEVTAVSIVRDLVTNAHHCGASDVHIEPAASEVQVRLRIDGTLEKASSIPLSVHNELLTRIKVLCGLRTDERMRPQDGRFRHVLDTEQSIDVRVAISPTYYGQKIVMRILAQSHARQSLKQLGLIPIHRKVLRRTLERSSGLILITGPTGSGKTTTAYQILRSLEYEKRSIVSIEDPVEYSMEGITQIEVNELTGLTFATGLRSILRQDPDILLVGEIRDSETARLAVTAALTGHLVIATLHTDSALSAIPRLTDLSVEPYLIAATLKLVIAQRLIRMRCGSCGQTDKPEVICTTCKDTRYAGRMGVFELLQVDEIIRTAIDATPNIETLREAARICGMRTLRQDAEEKARRGAIDPAMVQALDYE